MSGVNASRRYATVVLLSTTALACGSDEKAAPKTPSPSSASASPVETFFPLPEGHIFHYVTEDDGEGGMLVTRVHRTDATHAELRTSNATKRFVLRPDGVAYEGGAYILKAPLERGTSWPGEHGGTTRIDALDVEAVVPEGRFGGCLRTVEEGGRIPGARYLTTYCPGVGMVSLEVTAGGAQAKAALKSHGPPVNLAK